MKRELMIYFMNSQDKEEITYSLKILLRRAVEATLDYENFENDAQVSITFTDNEGIRVLNSQYRDIDKETDVLSFPLIDFESGEDLPIDDPEMMLGDIVISLERAREQAEEYGHSRKRELSYLVAHSVLHLLGYDHLDEGEQKAQMRAREEAVMAAMELTR